MKLILERWDKFLMESKEDYLVAFHCGKPNLEQDFDFKHLGSGEGTMILGPGIYFSTDKNIAERYCKYKEGAALYRAEIDMSGIYNPTTGQPQRLRDSILAIVGDIEKETGRDPYRGVLSLTHGKGSIGAIVKHYGPQRARDIMVQAGISGAVEKIGDAFEVALYNLSEATIEPIDTV